MLYVFAEEIIQRGSPWCDTDLLILLVYQINSIAPSLAFILYITDLHIFYDIRSDFFYAMQILYNVDASKYFHEARIIDNVV